MFMSPMYKKLALLLVSGILCSFAFASDNDVYNGKYDYHPGKFKKSSAVPLNSKSVKGWSTKKSLPKGYDHNLTNGYYLGTNSTNDTFSMRQQSGSVSNKKFYSEHIKVLKKEGDFDIYGDSAAGGSTSGVLNHIKNGKEYDNTLISTKIGTKYHINNDLGLKFEGQYNSMGKASSLLNGNGLSNSSKKIDTGIEYNF